MKYTDMIERGLEDKSLNLRKTADLITEKSGLKVDHSYLSKLKNGSKPPASDKLNDALAEILGLDPIELKAAGYREKIPADVLKQLQTSEKV